MPMWVYVALGGALGAWLRYAISGWVYDRLGVWFPWGTLVVNLLGSLGMGVALAFVEERMISPELRMGVLVGLVGALTTFSTFELETLQLLRDGEWGWAWLYFAGSAFLGLGLVWGGWQLARGLLGYLQEVAR